MRYFVAYDVIYFSIQCPKSNTKWNAIFAIFASSIQSRIEYNPQPLSASKFDGAVFSSSSMVIPIVFLPIQLNNLMVFRNVFRSSGQIHPVNFPCTAFEGQSDVVVLNWLLWTDKIRINHIQHHILFSFSCAGASIIIANVVSGNINK